MKKLKSILSKKTILISLSLIISISIGSLILKQKEEVDGWFGYWENISNIDECIGYDELTSDNTVVEMLGSHVQCVKNKEYEKAAHLFKLSSAYSIFDSKRVADISAHQAAIVLRMYSRYPFYDLYDEKTMQEEYRKLDEELMAISNDRNEFCDTLKKIGYPTYHPEYMINHGMGGREHDGKGIKIDFNAQLEWDLIVGEYCV